MDINDIFERLFNYFQTSTIRELSEKINMSESTVSKWRQRESVNAIKKKCREIGIYNEIFGDLTLDNFYQTGEHSQQIKTQHNRSSGMHNDFRENQKDLKDEDELQSLCNALIAVAGVLGKRDKLEDELKQLISKISKL